MLFHHLFPEFFSMLLKTYGQFLFILSGNLYNFFHMLFQMLNPCICIKFIHMIPLTMEQLLHISVLFQLFNLQTDLFLYLCLRIRTKSPDKFLYTVVHTLSERRTFCIIYIALQRIRIMDSHILQCHMYSPTHTSLFDHKFKSQCAHLFIQLSDMLCYVETNSS